MAAPVEERFQSNLKQISQLVANVIIRNQTVEGVVRTELVQMANSALELLDPKKLIEIFISNSYMFWPQIKGQKKDFFIDNAKNIFGVRFPQVKLDGFSIIFSKELITADEEVTLWKYFNQIVRQSIMYIYGIMTSKNTPKVIIEGVEFTQAQVKTMIIDYEVKNLT